MGGSGRGGGKFFLLKFNYHSFAILMKRGPKAPRTARRAVGARRAPQPSAGARRRGAERPELLVYIYYHITFLLCFTYVCIFTQNKYTISFPCTSILAAAT